MTLTKTTATDAQVAGARGEREYSTNPDLQVDFKKADHTKFGLDDYQSVLTQNYQQTENGKYISWKALATGQTDEVAAIALGNGDITKATFKTALDDQALMPNIPMPNAQTLTLTGKTHGTVEELLAYYPQQDTTKDDLVVGKLNVVGYDEIRKYLVLVEVNNATYPGNLTTLASELNKTYAQGVAQWAAVTKQSITVSGLSGKLDDGGSGLLSNYTPDMKVVLNAYTKNNSLANNTYYIFLIKSANDPNKLGYMPRSKQAGFIFVEAHKNDNIAQTIAHELGHGAFHLRHTFFENNIGQGTTENLMDYPARHRLDKWQWDKIHDPERVLGLFEGDEEGGMKYDCPKWFSVSTDCESVGKILGYIKTAVAENKKLIVNWPAGKSEIVAENIDLDGIRYEKIKILNSLQKEVQVIFDPMEYEDFSQDISMHNGKIDYQRGFVFKTEKEGLLPLNYYEVMTVLVIQRNDSENKFESLRKYLFNTTDSEDVFLQNIQWVSQFDETIFGSCTGCWTSTCCRRATEYMMGNTNIANCSDSTIATSAPYMTVLGSIITASFSDNSTEYTKETYNAASLNYNSTKAKDAVDYMMDRLRNNKPVLIGVHYTNGGKPPNNNNRATRHFMVVVGMTVKGESVSFRF